MMDPCSYLEPDPMLLASANGVNTTNPRFHTLNQAIVQLVSFKPRLSYIPSIVRQIEDHPLVQFLPLDLTSTESLETVLSHIDHTIQYGEDEEPKEVR
jgi:GPN-loop GTPase